MDVSMEGKASRIQATKSLHCQ